MSKKIVVADDELSILHVVSMKLRNAGYDVFTAEDGEEALELCRAEHPDMLITDLQMPYLNGLELCKSLHADDETRSIRKMMITARGLDIAPEIMDESGVSVVMSKPFSPREMLQKVVSMIGEAA